MTAPSGDKITAEGLSCYYGDVCAVKSLDLRVKPNSLLTIMGPTASGKTTFLRTLNRLNDRVPSLAIPAGCSWTVRTYMTARWMSRVSAGGSGWFSRCRCPCPSASTRTWLTDQKARCSLQDSVGRDRGASPRRRRHFR